MSELNLTKGEKVDLTKTHPGLALVHVGCGWDVAAAGNAFDLDVSAVLLKGDKSVPDKGVIFFNNKVGHGLEHMGDNLTGVGEGDDETIKVNLATVPADVENIAIIVNIYEARSRNQNFGQVKNAFVRVYDPISGGELAKYDLSEDYSAFTGMIMGRLYRHNGEWKFQAMGNGANGNINEICEAVKPLV